MDFPHIKRIKRDILLTEYVAEELNGEDKGKAIVALCPFHNDDSHPNLHAYFADERYYCFACGASGDVLSMCMELEGMSFVEAYNHLCDMIDPELRKPKKRGNDPLANIIQRGLSTD